MKNGVIFYSEPCRGLPVIYRRTVTAQKKISLVKLPYSHWSFLHYLRQKRIFANSTLAKMIRAVRAVRQSQARYTFRSSLDNELF
jgi:hypothetical protein